MEVCPVVHGQKHEPDQGVHDGEGDYGAGRTGRQGSGGQDDGRHLPSGQQAIDEVVGVVSVCVKGVTGPQPPQQAEVADVRPDSGPRGVRQQAAAEHRDGNYEHQVVEQLEPGGGAFAFLLHCAETGRAISGDPHALSSDLESGRFMAGRDPIPTPT